MASIRYEKLSEPLILGEGPHWDSERNVLYFVGIRDKKICKYDPESGKYTYAKIEREGYPSIIIPVKGEKEKFLVTIKRDICVVTWDGASMKPQNIEVIATLDEDYGFNTNDGKIDASGRLWSGTIGDIDLDFNTYPDNSVLYSFRKDRGPKVHQRNITISNGMDWSPDSRFMYYTDSMTYSVDVFDFDIENGEIANRRSVINLEKAGIVGRPDGMTVDADGKLWVAACPGKELLQIDPSSGKIVRAVPLPCHNVSSVAIGGPHLDELYVTSLQVLMSDAELRKFPETGCTFRITGVGVKGLPMHPFPL